MKQSSHRKFRRQMSKFILCVVLLCGFMTSCSQSGEIPDGYQYATCTGEYFRLFVPTQWTVQGHGELSGAVASLASEASVTMKQMNFENGHAPESLDDFWTSHLDDVAQMTGYVTEQQRTTTLAGYAAKETTYTAFVGSVDYRFRQVLTKAEGRFYLFTYSARKDSFDLYLDQVDGILENIQFYSVPYQGEEFSELPNTSDAPEGMMQVSGNQVSFRFYAPEHWKIGSANENCWVYASDEDHSNVSMLAYLPENAQMSVADYWEMSRSMYESNLEQFTLCDEPEKSTLGQRQATVYEYTYVLGGVTYHARQVIAVYSTMVYTMTYTALPQHYEEHMEDVLQMQEHVTWGR